MRLWKNRFQHPNLMKQIALILILTLLIPACGSNTSDVQQAAGGVWQAQLLGGNGAASGFSFVVAFTVSGAGGTLTFSSFQFLTSNPCFPVNNLTPTGSMQLTVNTNDYQVTGSFNFSVTANGNTLTLTSNDVTGTENGLYGTTLSNAVVTGNWYLTGSSECTVPQGGPASFTMTQSSSSTT